MQDTVCKVRMRNLVSCAALKLFLVLSVVSLAGEVGTKATHIMKETWGGHNENVELVYQDDHVAIYYDKDVNKNGNVTWPFEIISRSWKHLKETYGSTASLSHDPFLHVILHASKHDDCRTYSYHKSYAQSRNQIDCGQDDEIRTTPKGSKILQNLLLHMLALVNGEENALARIVGAIFGEGMLRIMWYDLNNFLKDSTALDVLTKILSKESKNRIYWFRDWFLPTYKQFGETTLLRNFFNNINTYNSFPNSSTNASKIKLNLGEFVHFWSEAAGQDLYPLAKLSINNSKELYTEIVKARQQFPVSNYAETMELKVWQERWDGHSEHLTLAFQDDHVAIYYDEDVNENGNVTWPFKIISRSWEYLKKTYGPSTSFSHDPLLYVILHASKYDECRTSLYHESDPLSRNQIDCGQDDAMGTTPENSDVLHNLLYYISELVIGENSALQKLYDTVIVDGMDAILWYDLNIFLNDPTTNLAAETEISLKDSKNEIYWFRDWFLPTYKQFGETTLLKNFFNILNTYNNFSSYPTIASHKMLNLGEFVHFWSEAARQDLYPLAKLLINNSRELYAEIIEARKTFPLSNYEETMELKVWQETWDGHSELLTLAFQNDHVAIYYDADVNKNGNVTWPLEIISKGWEYLKETYGPSASFSHDPLLYVILHASKHVNCRTSSYHKSNPQSRNQIDCGQNDAIGTTPENSDVLHNLLYYISELVIGENSALQKLYDTVIVDGMDAILWYDLNNFLKDPTTNLDAGTKISLKDSKNGIYWFRDWFLPTHKQFGETKLLKNFFNILNTYNNLSSSPTMASQKMLNLGEFVHFWSGAAQTDLLPTAIHSINNSKEFYAELVEARTSFPFITYIWENCTARGNVVSCGSEVCDKNVAWRCNGKMECSDGSDEANCTDCGSNAFACAKGGCVDEATVCDYKSDCPLDESDEGNCTDVWNPKSWLRTWKPPRVELERVYLDKDVVLYFGPNMNSTSLWISQIYTKAWSHVKRTYGTFGRNPGLAVFLGAYDGTKTDCVSYLSTLKRFFYRSCMDCGSKGWALEDSSNFEHVLRTFVNIIRTETREKNNPKSIDIEVPRFEMGYIIQYDLYVELKGVSDAEVSAWKEMQLNRTWKDVHFFRDWFLPIYETYGGSIALRNFYRIAKSQWGKGLKQKSRTHLNVGEFVHFWSGAAGADLLPIALQVFNDSFFLHSLLKKAKENFPSINYTATPCRGGQFRCEKDFVCIQENWRCNKIQDCSDNSDEANCGEAETSHVVPIVFGILVLGILVASIGVGWKISSDRRKIQNLSQQIRNLTNEEVNDFLKGSVNLNGNDANGSIHSKPFISDYEINPEQLVISDEHVLGSGEFGVVKRGKLQIDNNVGSCDQTVAVKMMKPNAKVDYFKAFLVEIKIMAFLGRHQNIASLLGTVTSNIRNCEVFVALEFCSNGDLLRFLRKACGNFQDLFCQKAKNVTSVVFTTGKSNDTDSSVAFVAINVPETPADSAGINESLPISTLDLLEWSRQIADGMNYLTTKKVIHGDLAARNVLLTENKTAKISDFGLSRQLMNYSNYLKTTVSPLPWRWMATESLSNMEFSIHSDVWAFGVTLWEIFTLGKIPYPERSWNQAFMNDLANGMRLPFPQNGNDKINKLMMNCMELVPAERIQFSEISLELQRIKQSLISEANAPSTSQGGSTSNYTVLE